MRRWIYALYDRAGKCLYVGNTLHPRSRMVSLWKYGTGTFYQPEPIRFFCGMILREVVGAERSLRLERQITISYWRKGEATLNRQFVIGNIRATEAKLMRSSSMYFRHAEHAKKVCSNRR